MQFLYNIALFITFGLFYHNNHGFLTAQAPPVACYTENCLIPFQLHIIRSCAEDVCFSYLIYGSIATVVVALLSVNVIALVLLLGAQVIAELERKPDELTEEK
jgi:hypothetical protein